MRNWMIGVGVVVAGCLQSACDEDYFDIEPPPTVISSSGTYAGSGVTFAIVNPADGETVFVDRCQADLQRLSLAGDWRVVVGRVCSRDPGDSRFTVRLLPGEQLADTTFRSVVLGGGQYRAAFYVSDDTTAVVRLRVFSNTFVVSGVQAVTRGAR